MTDSTPGPDALRHLDRALLADALFEARIGVPTDTPHLADELLPPLLRLLTEAALSGDAEKPRYVDPATLPDSFYRRNPDYQGEEVIAALSGDAESGLDVERLARAIHRSNEHSHRPGCLDMDRDTAGYLAAEYERLSR